MSTFSVASMAYNGYGQLQGQSFTPNVAGPDGSGSPGAATQVTLTQIIFGYPVADNSNRSGTCYLFSNVLDDPSAVSTTTDGLVASTSDVTDGSELGSGSHSRRFNFSNVTLAVGTTYFAYFTANQVVRFDTPRAYSGGNALDDAGDELNYSLQFKVSLNT